MNNPRFAAHDHQAVFINFETRGAEAVAIERGAHIAAIAEHHGGRAIPRFVQTGMKL